MVIGKAQKFQSGSSQVACSVVMLTELRAVVSQPSFFILLIISIVELGLWQDSEISRPHSSNHSPCIEVCALISLGTQFWR